MTYNGDTASSPSPSPRSKQPTSIDGWLDVLRARAKEAPVERTKTAQPSQLPLWEELERAIPNHLARSSLFAPVARGKRKFHDGTTLPSRRDVTLRYWGKQLDEPDCDVWMQALHVARQVPLGQPILVKRAAFLRAIGRHRGKYEYDWLHESFHRLSLGKLEIKTKKYKLGDVPQGVAPDKKIHRVLHLVDGFDFDEELDEYVLRIDPRMLALFSNSEFALIDWEKRMRIMRQTDMTKWLQRLVATSNEQVQRHSLEDLKERMQYASPMRKFKAALAAAMHELERLEIVAAARIERSTRGKEQAVWCRI